MFELQSILNFTAYLLLFIVLFFILTHIISRIHNLTKPHLKLNSQSLVVITGAAMGIGRLMAIQIARLYHSKILLVDIKRQLFSQLQSTLKQFGSTVQSLYCDLSDDQSVSNFINFLNNKNQHIHLFIHNAGVHIPKKALQTSDKQFMLQYKINFISPVKIIKNTINLMQNGHIAVVASMAALAHGGIDVSTYSSSKYALYSFINSFRQQLKVSNRKTTISMGCPFMIKTGMFDGFKTRLDFLFRHLQPEYVAKRLVKQFIQKKEICYIYEYEALLFKIVNFLPTEFLDLFSIKFNVSNFDGIRNKHQDKISKIK